jgi:hypothetical protein
VALEEPDHIRIGVLEPGNELRCAIMHADINSPPTFSAISYVWGNGEKKHQMHVGKDSYVSLTESLHNILQHFRSMGLTTFWADQICINQDDAEERSGQVSLMSTIYRNASGVVVYIAPEQPELHQGLALAQNLIAEYGLKSPSEIEQIAETTPLVRFDIEDDDPAWVSLRMLVQKQWTGRVWMVQEQVVNHNTVMVFGKTCLPWIVLPKLVQLVHLHVLPMEALYLPGTEPNHHIIDGTLTLLSLSAAFAAGLGNQMSLAELLNFSQTLCSSDPRDKIYALLGLAKDSGSLNIKPDYSLSVREVYTQTAMQLLCSTPNLDLLSSFENPKSTDFPSWVPDWTKFFNASILDSSFQASNSTSPHLDFDQGSVLIAEGAVIDTITHIVGIFGRRDPPSYPGSGNELVDYPAFRRLVKDCWQQWRKSDKVKNMQIDPHAIRLGPDITSMGLTEDGPTYSFLEAFFRTILRNKGLTEADHNEVVACFNAYLLVFHYAFDLTTSRQRRESLPQQPDRDQIIVCTGMSQRAQHAFGRLICITESNQICLAPASTRVGDCVSILLGGRMLYILRSLGTEFEFVGDAYILGLMNGEVLDDPKLRNNLQNFRII